MEEIINLLKIMYNKESINDFLELKKIIEKECKNT